MLSRQSRHRWRTRCIHRRSRGGERPQRVLVGIDAEMLEDVNMRELPHHRVVRRRCAADAACCASCGGAAPRHPGARIRRRREAHAGARRCPQPAPAAARRGPPAACEQAHTLADGGAARTRRRLEAPGSWAASAPPQSPGRPCRAARSSLRPRLPAPPPHCPAQALR